ncbi:hypothetical protein [Levilactobacillus parabrevis]|uniref:hypothetical protein n=1 Tax=Levilactobacillus parabrevis TaxID=357278 RepID=UPI00035FF741|nr:hypothetical protein [Levilactobacillus parabrevis]
MKFTQGLALVATTVLFCGGAATVTASASAVELTGNAPESGSVTLNSDDSVVSASSNELLAEIDGSAQKAATLLRTVVNMKSGRWVYYSDHHNYLNKYKWGHSNYYRSTSSHESKAKVGSKSSGWVSASAHHYSKATAKGKGTFKAYYSNN